MHAMCVVILALGLQPRQRLVKVRAKSEARESHFMLPKVWESVREWTFTPKWIPTLGVWVLMDESLNNKCKGQNPLDWKVIYIIGKILELKDVKWVPMTHLGT